MKQVGLEDKNLNNEACQVQQHFVAFPVLKIPLNGRKIKILNSIYQQK